MKSFIQSLEEGSGERLEDEEGMAFAHNSWKPPKPHMKAPDNIYDCTSTATVTATTPANMTPESAKSPAPRNLGTLSVMRWFFEATLQHGRLWVRPALGFHCGGWWVAPKLNEEQELQAC